MRQPYEGEGLSPPPRGRGLEDEMLSESSIYEALKNVQEPELGRDIVSLNMVKEVEIADSSVALKIE